MNVVLIDTAGRLHVDEDMMQELAYKSKHSGRCHSPCGRCHDREMDAVNVARHL